MLGDHDVLVLVRFLIFRRFHIFVMLNHAVVFGSKPYELGIPSLVGYVAFVSQPLAP